MKAALHFIVSSLLLLMFTTGTSIAQVVTNLQLDKTYAVKLIEVEAEDGSMTRPNYPQTIRFENVEQDGYHYIKVLFEDEKYNHEFWFWKEESNDNIEKYSFYGEENIDLFAEMTFYSTKMTAEEKDLDFKLVMPDYWGKSTYTIYLEINHGLLGTVEEPAQAAVEEEDPKIEIRNKDIKRPEFIDSSPSWKQLYETLIKLRDYSDEEYAALKGEPTDPSNLFFESSKSFDLGMFETAIYQYVYDEIYTEALMIKVENVKEQSKEPVEDFYDYRIKFLDLISYVMGEDYGLLGGEDGVNNSKYVTDYSWFYIWKPMDELEVYAHKGKFVRFNYRKLNDTIYIYFHNEYPLK